MNLKDTLNYYRQSLKDIYEDQEIVATFYMVSEHIFQLGRAALTLKMQDEVSDSNGDKYRAVLAELKTLKPLQYILGEAYFYGLKFKVNPAVLIPRPETEELVEMVIHSLEKFNSPVTVFDIGTGSGCIAISIKKNAANVSMSALDISEQALAVATENARENDVAIDFISADIRSFQSDKRFDVIVSNPPYITEAEQQLMDKNVTGFEPHLALFVADHHPLEFYEAIADFAGKALRKNGLLFFEINANFGAETARMLMEKHFVEVLILKDMQGKDRFISAKKKA